MNHIIPVMVLSSPLELGHIHDLLYLQVIKSYQVFGLRFIT